jgi:hypothetical protein
MSASTSTLIDKISQLDEKIREEQAAGRPIASLQVDRLDLIKQLNEANAALQGKDLLKG